MSEWQPIETAPKDGTSVLVVGAYGYVLMARWKEMTRVPSRWESYGLGAIRFEPTHWMPLPEPPKT